MNNIFVSIASYRDNLLEPTIRSLITNESGRNNIVYGIFEQIKFEDSLEAKSPDLVKQSNIRYKRIDPEYSDGVVWAREINSKQVYKEDFIYQIDSHMLFDKDWDHFLMLDYNQAKKIADTEKIIVTTGCKNFEVFDNQIIKHTLNNDITVKFGYFQFGKDLSLKAHGPWIQSTDFVTPAIHAIAGNFFTTTKWIKDVGYNTRLYFDYEEQYMALSSILAGYKIYHQRKIKCYHYLDSASHISKQEVKPVISLEKIARNKERGKREFINYIYSLDEEKLNEFFKITGVDYINRKLEDRAISRLAKPQEGIENDWEIFNPAVNNLKKLEEENKDDISFES